MTTTDNAPAAPAKPAKLPREEDPRNPNIRLAAFFDDGTVELISPDDDSGMLAAVGTVAGVATVAFCSDATVMGGAMGDEVRIRCTQTATQVLAEATVTFRAWLRPSPDWSFTVAATARKETLPS